MNIKNPNHINNAKRSRTSLAPTVVGPYGLEVLDEKDFGTETEAEKQMKLLLEKQLKTDMTLSEHMAQHREFIKSNTFKSMTELIHGTCSLKTFQKVEKNEEKRQELQQSGLTEEEIGLYMAQEDLVSSKLSSRRLEPSVLNEKLDKVKEKITTHQKQLQRAAATKGVKSLSRHAMDIEKTLYIGCKEKKQLDHLIVKNSEINLSENDPYKHIKDLSNKLAQKTHRKRKKVSKEVAETEEHLDRDNSLSDFVYDPNIHHVMVPLNEQEICEKRLTIEEIKRIPRFENYDPGIPNKVLYVKNLHPKVTIKDLQILFGHFQSDNDECIDYNLLTGRMKGQAFITFQDIESAQKALHSVNGFLLRERPVIIIFGTRR